MPQRKLTEKEIKYLTSGLQDYYYCIIPEIGENALKRIRLELEIQLRRVEEDEEFLDEMLPQLKNRIELDFLSSLAQPGETSGIVGSISSSHQATQMILNSHKSMGQERTLVVKGVPRIAELIGLTKNLKSPVTTIYFVQRKSFEDVKKIGISLIHRKIKDFVKHHLPQPLGGGREKGLGEDSLL